MKYFGALAFLLLAIALPAQEIIEEPQITRMMESYQRYNESHQEVRGWRIQILATTDRRQMESARGKFRARYPAYKLEFTHRNPYYNLKTGAFLTRQEARPLLKKLQRDYPGAFLVSDVIELQEVLDNP